MAGADEQLFTQEDLYSYIYLLINHVPFFLISPNEASWRRRMLRRSVCLPVCPSQLMNDPVYEVRGKKKKKQKDKGNSNKKLLLRGGNVDLLLLLWWAKRIQQELHVGDEK